MPTPYSSQDISRSFDGRSLSRGRSLILGGGVVVRLDGASVVGEVTDHGTTHRVSLTPVKGVRRLVFDQRCSCGTRGCVHLAAAAFAALDNFPELRQPEQQSFLDTLVAQPTPAPKRTPAPPQVATPTPAPQATPRLAPVPILPVPANLPVVPDPIAPRHVAPPAPRPTAASVAPPPELRRVAFEVAPGEPPYAFVVATLIVGVKSGTATASCPAQVTVDRHVPASVHEAARVLGGAKAVTPVTADKADAVLTLLARSKHARWHAGGQRLFVGKEMVLPDASGTYLPPDSGIIVSATGPWYVDAASGAVGRLRIRAPMVARQPAPPPVSGPRGPAAVSSPAPPIIVERKPTPRLHLTRFPCPDGTGRMQLADGLLLEFDYAGPSVAFDDERQFVKDDAGSGHVFVRRDKTAEAAALEVLRDDGLAQLRVDAVQGAGQGAKGRIILTFRGRDAAEAWQRFVVERLPALAAEGWCQQIDNGFGPRLVETVGECDLRVADAAAGRFSLDLGIEIDGVRQPLLPILMHVRERGGIEAARVVDGEIITSLEDGRIIRLPADRIGRLLAVIDSLAEVVTDTTGDTIELEPEEASSVLDLEELVATRWQDGTEIAAMVARFRPLEDIPDIAIPPGFTAALRDYQRHGVNWLQHLRAEGVGGLLADDMGLGKTAQAIAHLVVEEAAGRLEQPALVVVPTSLVPNWTAELARFAPHLRVQVLHGTDRHAKRRDLAGTHVVITTYAVLTRDIDEMAALPWHMVVLDEAQAIKSTSAQATHAVCRLDTRHRLCLSGTPIENNLGELWSLFAFLAPGLLGSRKSFTRRFRTPIERDADQARRGQLAARIRPFILRRTKGQVATELPPKHTILRRVTLAPEQRDLYETIQAAMQEKVAKEIAARGLARSHVVVLGALLKLRQVCCDPRLLKLATGGPPVPSGKLEELMEMVTEMIAEGRRILLFSQFTSMLDLIKPALDAAGIRYVELRGDTVDRAAPVQRFEAGEVPLFLISLKAGGRGLNLVSADTVIHYDPWWNPAVEEQASDRAHRIGQTKSVFVYKLVAADTVEERILELQERKAALANIAFGDGAGLEGIVDGDIEFLFGTEEGRIFGP